MEDRAELVGVAFVEGVEIVLDHGFDAGTVMAHGLSSLNMHKACPVLNFAMNSSITPRG